MRQEKKLLFYFRKKQHYYQNLFVLIFPECSCAYCGHVKPQRIVGVCQLIHSRPQCARTGECVQCVCVCVCAAKIMPCIITDVIHPGILNQIKSNRITSSCIK